MSRAPGALPTSYAVKEVTAIAPLAVLTLGRSQPLAAASFLDIAETRRTSVSRAIPPP